MKLETKQKLLDAWRYCDIHDKSTGFMIQHMMDSAGVDHDCVMSFIEKTSGEERSAHYKMRYEQEMNSQKETSSKEESSSKHQ